MDAIKKETPTIEPITPVENKEFWLVTRIKTHAKEKPKKTFLIMFSMVAISVIISIGQLIYVRTVEVPKYEKMKMQNIFKDAGNSLSEPVRATENVMEIQEVMKELHYYKIKKTLTKQDSIRIKYLIDKYKLTSKK